MCLLVRDPRAANWSDTATARRRQREEDATRVGLQFPFHSERRGRGAPSVAMKWRDAVKSAIMHGPLPPDVTLDVPYWWQPGVPLLRPADYMAPVQLKRKRDMAAEPKTEHTCAYPTRRSCGSWFSTPIMRVSMARHTLAAFARRSSWCWSSSDLWHPTRSAGGMTAAHPMLTSAADRPWNCQAQSQHPLLAARPPPCAARARELEPTRHWTRQFLHSLQLSLKLAATCIRRRRARLTLPESATSYSCESYTCAMRNLAGPHVEPGRDSAHGSSRRAWVDQKSRVSLCLRLARLRHGHARCEHEVWTQNVYEGKSDRVQPHGPLFPRQLVTHSPTHWITQEALMDMIDAIDADMNARAGDAEPIPWLLVLDCAPQHVAEEFRSIMRDTRSHIKRCCVQRNFTAYTQPVDRAYMRAFKSSIRQEVAKHFAEIFLEAESNFESVNLDSSTSVLRQLLLSFVHTAAQNADSPQHRAAAWRFIDWNEVEQRELLAEAKTSFWRRERTVSTRHSRGASRARCRGRSHRQRARGARVGATGETTAATARARPLVSRNQRHQRHQQLQLLQREKQP